MRRPRKSSLSSAKRVLLRRSKIFAISSMERGTAASCRTATWMRVPGAVECRRAHPRHPDLQGIDRPDHGRGPGNHQEPSRREANMDALPELLETIEDGVATLTFNR